jgi:hypothetical protein
MTRTRRQTLSRDDFLKLERADAADAAALETARHLAEELDPVYQAQ